MKKESITKSPLQTQKLGGMLAKKLLKNRPKNRAVVVGLRGDLGGGKTTFLQGFAKGLGFKGRVLSPTFIIMRRQGNFYHIDAYRLRKTQELLSLGFKEIVSVPKNVIVIEWADRVCQIMPKNTIWIDFKFISKNERKITINHF